MKINELKDGMNNIDVEGMMTGAIGNSRIVQLKSGTSARVRDIWFDDDTGRIKLSLWNEQVDLLTIGQKATIKGGYVNTFRGELQLNVGKFGKLIPGKAPD